MTINEAIEKLKNVVEKFSATEQKFKDVKLNDGTTIVSYDGEVPAQGMPLFVVTPEGRIPAPDGEHTLEDGTVLVVIGGLIAEVKEPEVEEVEAPEGEATVAPEMAAKPEAVAPKRVIKSQVEEHVFHLEIEGVEPIKVDFSSMFKAYNDKFAALEKENTELKAEFNKNLEFKKEVVALVSEIAEQPAAESSVKEPNKFKKKLTAKDVKLQFRETLK